MSAQCSAQRAALKSAFSCTIVAADWRANEEAVVSTECTAKWTAKSAAFYAAHIATD
jgi:hypothetical protein